MLLKNVSLSSTYVLWKKERVAVAKYQKNRTSDITEIDLMENTYRETQFTNQRLSLSRSMCGHSAFVCVRRGDGYFIC